MNYCQPRATKHRRPSRYCIIWGEGCGNHRQLEAMLAQVDKETRSRALAWLPITTEMVARTESASRNAPASTYLRASDALHLACAAEHGFKEIYSNDQHLLSAAPLFGLRGINVIPSALGHI